MTVMFDTNVYISFIRDQSHGKELQRRGTVKYISAITLMELWAGARTKKAERLLFQLQKPYADAGRIVSLRVKDHIAIGRFFAAFPNQHHSLVKMAGFVNDVQIAFGAISIGATLYTEDRDHFQIVRERLKALKVEVL